MDSKSEPFNLENRKTEQLSFSNIKIDKTMVTKYISYGLLILFLILVFYYFFIKEDDNKNINTLEKMILEEEKYFFKDIKQSELIINDIKNNIYENLIIGINFGNIYSEYSYNFGKNISTIISDKKKSTELELSKETKNGLKYSYKSSISLMNYKNDELDKIIFLKGFKTLLYEDNNENELYYEYNLDKNIEKNIIFRQYFSFLKNETLTELKNYKKSFIKWVLTIPVNIGQFEKQLIKNITTELEMYNIDFIYESEASSLALYYDKSIPDLVKKENKTFMLIDAGGYSIDISIYKIIDQNGTIKQINGTESLKLGLFDIGNKIIKIFKEIFGEKIINKIKKNEPGDWIKFLNDINKIIENSYNINGIEIYEMKNYFGKKEGNYIYNNQSIKVDKININFPLSLSSKIISENMNLINEKTNEIIADIKLQKKIKINNILCTGGLSRNKIFKEKMKSNFNNSENFIYYISSYENIISKGAVIHGIYPNRIKSRISPITLGIRKNNINDKKEKIELIVKKGEEIKNHLVKYIQPNSNEQDYIKINIYSFEEEFKSLEELENHLSGKIVLKLDKNSKGYIKLNINYDTTISFFANYENGKEVESYFEYYKL